MFKVTLRNKKDGEVISTNEHGVVAQVYIHADGSYELDEVGTITDQSSFNGPSNDENYFNSEDYEIVEFHFELPLSSRKQLLSKVEMIRELKPLLSDAALVHHFDELNIDSVNGFLVTLLSDSEEKELHSALLEMDFITEIYPRGHFLSDQQNWKVRFIPVVKENEFKTRSSMAVTEIHEGIEEVIDMSKVSNDSPYGKFLHNNNIEGLGKYLVCVDVIRSNGNLYELDVVDKKGKSQLISVDLLYSNDVTLITDKYVPAKEFTQLVHKFRARVRQQLSFCTHGKKIELNTGRKGLIIGQCNEYSTWGCFTVAIIDSCEVMYFDGGDVAHGIVKYLDDVTICPTFEEVRVGNEMAEILFSKSNSVYVQKSIGFDVESVGGKTC